MSPFGETRKIMDSGAAELCSVRTCPVCVEDYFQSPLFFEVLRVCAIFSELKSEDHKVTGSKPVSVRILFFVDFPVSGVVRAKPQKVKL